jgi:nucleotide-binding universal stress UspA family protein
MFRNILVLVDGSQHSDRALAEAIDIAMASGARLTIMTAVKRPSGWVSTPTTAAVLGSLGPQLERESEETLDAAVDRVPESVPVTKILTHKPIKEALAHQIREACYDLIVMGSRGRGAIAASVLGSVSHFALNHSPIALLIVHDQEPAERPTEDDAAHLVAA